MIYRVSLFGANGRMASTHRISALDDAEALEQAMALLEASTCASFALWQGGALGRARRLDADGRPTKAKSAAEAPLAEASAARRIASSSMMRSG